jgi:16S rRNA (cytosine1402-N4)-methyltransferase
MIYGMCPDDAPQPHRRRERYRGTHPRHFDQKYKELAPEQYPEMQGHIRDRGGTPAGTHVPILVPEILAALDPQPGEIVADCTLGYGGHAAEFLQRIGPTGRLLGFDLDAAQLARTTERLTGLFPDHQLEAHHSNFAGVAKQCPPGGPDTPPGYDIIFADLGVSSMQIDDPSRGFSYKHDGPLDMRMDLRLKQTAADLLATMPPEDISTALRGLADEPDHHWISRHIARNRATRPIRTTRQLVQIILAAKGLPPDFRREPGSNELHPAARTFQALRILVNDELGSLKTLLRQGVYCLRPGGRIGIITFHSGEDELVEGSLEQALSNGVLIEVAKDPIRPTPQERRDNPRSSSARFRWGRAK